MRDFTEGPADDDGDDGLHHDMEGVIGDLDLETLSGDIRDEMLARVKHLRAPWPQLPQGEQYELANGLELFSKSLIRRVVGLLNSHRWPHAVVMLEELKIADKGLVGKITAQNIAVNRDAMGEHVGELCQMIMVDSETFFGERAPVEIDPDQPGMDLEGAKGHAEAEPETAPPPPEKGKKGKPARGGKPDSFFGDKLDPDDLK